MDDLFERMKELDREYVMQTYKRLPVAFLRGEGTRLWDSEGKSYLDLVAGLGVTILGHSHPAVVEAICEQAVRLLHTTNLYYVEPQVELARILSENFFKGRCFFANSGAEANEGALKLARKYHFLKGKPRYKVVCVEGSFHGRTLATMSATGQPDKWKPFAPAVSGFEHVPLNDIDALETAVDSETSAVILEPVLGEGGVYPATAEFLKAARATCDDKGAVLVADEVQSGLGRTGKLLAIEHSGVKPDVITMAKGLANGVPAAAFMAAGEFGEVLTPGDHGTTFGGGFLACAAATATLSTLMHEDLSGNAASIGDAIMKRLQSLLELPVVEEVRGMGLMIAVQLKTEAARQVVLKCLERGVLVNDVGPETVRLLPPLILTEEEAMEGVDVLAEAIAGLPY